MLLIITPELVHYSSGLEKDFDLGVGFIVLLSTVCH